VVAHIGPGEGFGERGLLDNAPRNATVTTEQETTVLRIEGDVLLEALTQAPMLTAALNRSNAGGALADIPADGTPLIDDLRWEA
jgi:CRP-like cAMP-binding protein